MQTKIFKRLGERIRKRIYIMRCQRALVIAYNSFMMSVREDNITTQPLAAGLLKQFAPKQITEYVRLLGLID